MRILGIETSCDETAVCLIEAEGAFGPSFKFKVLGNALYSQAATHAQYGGVFPNLAKREHAKNLIPLLSQALPETHSPHVGHTMSHIEQILEREPGLFEQLKEFLETHGRPDIDVLAVTCGPGLEPALWVGVNFAKALAAVWEMPIVGVNHLEGHIAMAAMHGEQLADFEFPALALLISGGHTEIDLIREWPRFEIIGQTRDDAVGEAYDKVARMLGIPYPGGAELSRLAGAARALRRAPQFKFSRPMLNQDNFDFSFSGLKTEVRKMVGERTLTDDEKMDIACEFETAAADVLVAKTARAVEEYGAQTVLVGGGVSANSYIKGQLAAKLDIPVLTPPPELATDNALMIALAGYFHALNKEFADPSALRADGNLSLGN